MAQTTKHTPKSKSTPVTHYISSLPVFHQDFPGVTHLGTINLNPIQDDAYLQGKIDGKKDKEIELMRMAKALYQMAFDNVSKITQELANCAEKEGIIIYDFHLKMDNWDKLKSLIIVKTEDFIDDKIYNLYDKATKLAHEYNCDSFHWDYSITYYSDNLSREKIYSDGYTLHYEHTTRPRTPQQESV